MGDVFCKNCGSKNKESYKFCSECGKSLTSAVPCPPEFTQNKPVTPPPAGFHPFGMPRAMGKAAVVDSSLIMLAEYCRKTCATIGGDGHTEWVLYQRPDGTPEIHFFENYAGYTEEIHRIAPAPADTWNRILAIKEKYNLRQLPPERNMGMCGGMTLIKIRDGDKMIRIVSGMLTSEESQGFSEIQSLLTGIPV